MLSHRPRQPPAGKQSAPYRRLQRYHLDVVSYRVPQATLDIAAEDGDIAPGLRPVRRQADGDALGAAARKIMHTDENALRCHGARSKIQTGSSRLSWIWTTGQRLAGWAAWTSR